MRALFAVVGLIVLAVLLGVASTALAQAAGVPASPGGSSVALDVLRYGAPAGGSSILTALIVWGLVRDRTKGQAVGPDPLQQAVGKLSDLHRDSAERDRALAETIEHNEERSLRILEKLEQTMAGVHEVLRIHCEEVRVAHVTQNGDLRQLSDRQVKCMSAQGV